MHFLLCFIKGKYFIKIEAFRWRMVFGFFSMLAGKSIHFFLINIIEFCGIYEKQINELKKLIDSPHHWDQRALSITN